MSSHHVCSFIGSTVNSSSFAVMSVNSIRIKMHNCAVSLTSVDSSNCCEKHSQSAMSFQSCLVKFSAMASLHRVTVLLDSWRALIEASISLFVFKVSEQQVSCFNKCFFYQLSIFEGFLVFNDEVMLQWLPFAFEVSCEKNDCCPDSWDSSSFTFLLLSLLFGGNSVS